MTTSARAFTLLELLVVVAIMSVLIALLMPTLRQARETSRIVGCQMELRSDGILKSMVGQDTRYMVPVAEAPSYAQQYHGRTFFLNKTAPHGVFWPWFNILDQWAGEDPQLYRKARKGVCPSFDNSHLQPTAMSYRNSYVWTMALPHIDYGGNANRRRLPLRYERVLPYVLLETEFQAYPTPNDTYYYFYPTPYYYGVGYKEVDYRHLGRANFLSHDGSVVAYEPDAVPDDRWKSYR